MDSTNWRPTQGASSAVVDPYMDSGDWRAQLQADSRQMDTLKRHLPFSGNEGLQELKKIAVRFEEKIYTAATSQLIGQHNNLSSMQQQSGQQQQLLGSQSGNSNMQTNQHSMQQMLQSSMPMQQQNHQSSATLLPTQAQQSLTQLQQQQQQVMHQQPNLLQRDMQQRLPISGVFQQQNVIDQQKQIFQQQRAMPEASSTSLDSTAQTGNSNGGDWQEEAYQKIKAMKDLYLLDLNDMHQKILGKLQQFDSLPQQPKNDQLDKLKMFKSMLERYIQLLQIPNKHNILANYKDKLGTYEKKIIQVINSHRRKNGAPQQQAQALPPAHMQSMQQSQAAHSQWTQVQSHEAQMNLQGSMAAMQPNNMGNLQQSMPMQQQNRQSSATLLPTQVQQSLTQLQQQQQQQQVMPHMQSQPGQMQQQVGMQQQPNLMQHDMQQRLPTSGVFQQQNVIDQQKQIIQQQRAMPEASSNSTAQTGNSNGGDWQEEVYQKIKAMKDLYLLDLNDMHQEILGKLQQFDSLPQQPKNDQLDKLKMFKSMLERYIQLLQIPNKHNILANYKDKLGTYEKKIIQVINSHRRKNGAPQQQAQALPPARMQSMQQSQQTHPQLTQVQSHETQMNLQVSMAAMQPNNMGNLQQSTASSLSGGSNVQQNMMNSMQPSSNLESGQNTSPNSLQQVSSASLQQNTVSGPSK